MSTEKTFKFSKKTAVYKLPWGVIYKLHCMQLINNPFFRYFYIYIYVCVCVYASSFCTVNTWKFHRGLNFQESSGPSQFKDFGLPILRVLGGTEVTPKTIQHLLRKQAGSALIVLKRALGRSPEILTN